MADLGSSASKEFVCVERGAAFSNAWSIASGEEKIAKAAEIKQQRKIATQKALEAEELEEQRKTIMMSYSSAAQITRLKDERIAALERNIETAPANLIIQEKNQKDLMSRAADKERSGEKVSDVFLSQIDQIKDQIQYQKEFIADKTAEIVETRDKYDGHLAKFPEFTGQENAANASDS